MIRRDFPLGADAPTRWLLIRQPDHARISYELAESWGGPHVARLVCAPDDETPLAAVRRELLAAIRQHDDGWIGYQPLRDDASGLPLNFTEMPADAAQAIWSRSIDACREIGPLAGWVVASHFHALQAKHDEDHSQWEAWLAAVELRREAWLDEWLAVSDHHTETLADRCLAWLQAFDWMSLWLCCACPIFASDRVTAPLTLGSEATGWPTIHFQADPPFDASAVRRVTASPWPFAVPRLELVVDADVTASDGASAKGAERQPLAWRIEPPLREESCSPRR